MRVKNVQFQIALFCDDDAKKQVSEQLRAMGIAVDEVGGLFHCEAQNEKLGDVKEMLKQAKLKYDLQVQKNFKLK